MLRSETVVDGDDGGGEFSSEAAAEVIVGLGAGGKEHEAAAVEIDDDRKIFPGSGTTRKEVAKPQVPGGVDCGVGGGNAFNWLVGGGNAFNWLVGGGHFEVNKCHETAVDGAITANRCIRDGVQGGKDEPDPPWKLQRGTEFAAGRTGHFSCGGEKWKAVSLPLHKSNG